ncbi:MAG: hypothetical protein OEN01_01695 [Candidatus Krumholzibacteria bacterium]|nr:hypothetical protein [Candidatus Krumholzibacteria bacterium]
MKEERRQILDMLAQGKITAEDAERLLDKLGVGHTGHATAPESAGRGGSSKLKYLRVKVDSSEGDKVNIRVPLALIKTGIKLTAVLPDDVNQKLGEQGVDLGRLSELDSDELYESLRELQVDVDSGEGDVVRVFCE